MAVNTAPTRPLAWEIPEKKKKKKKKKKEKKENKKKKKKIKNKNERPKRKQTNQELKDRIEFVFNVKTSFLRNNLRALPSGSDS